MAAKGKARWQGDLKSGNGSFAAGEGISGEYSFNSRFEDGPGANPEQLIAAAHAACFSMSLSKNLADAGTPVDSVETDAAVTLRMVEGVPTITEIALETVGAVPGVSQADFQEQAENALKACVVSRALAGVEQITVSAKLAS